MNKPYTPPVTSLPGYVCTKHGPLDWAVMLDNRRFCPKCTADHLQRTIGEVRTA